MRFLGTWPWTVSGRRYLPSAENSVGQGRSALSPGPEVWWVFFFFFCTFSSLSGGEAGQEGPEGSLQLASALWDPICCAWVCHHPAAQGSSGRLPTRACPCASVSPVCGHQLSGECLAPSQSRVSGSPCLVSCLQTMHIRNQL